MSSENLRTRTKFEAMREIVIDSRVSLNRGYQELLPRTAYEPKLVLSLIHQLRSYHPEMPQQIFLFSGHNSHDEQLGRLWPELTNISGSLPQVISMICRLKEPSVFIAAGKHELAVNREIDRLTAAYRSLFPGIQEEFIAALRNLIDEQTDFVPFSYFVVQERPGKSTKLKIAGHTLKALKKDTIGTLKPHKDVVALRSGWGIGGLVAAPSMSQVPSGARKDIIMSEIDILGESYSINLMQRVFDHAQLWLETHGFTGDTSPDQYCILLPNFVLNGAMQAVASHKIPAQKMLWLDAQWGWHPTLTLFSLLARKTGSYFLLDMSRLPRLTYVGIRCL